jgi:hypothetical protein
MEDNILNERQSSEVEKGSDVKQTGEKEDKSQLIDSSLKSMQSKDKFLHILHIILFIFIPVLVVLFLIIFVLYFVPVLQEIKSGTKTEISNNPMLKKDAGYNKQISLLVKDIQRLTRKYSTYSTGLSYIVINTTDNKFFLYKNKKLIREGSCSTGSYKKLLTAEGRSWTFKTPRGKFTIQGKRTNPAWHKPDWAFIEEGVPVPPKDSPLRWEAGVLGDYAMDLGDSYMIHGTIYKRFLGMPVTHGCVRLNDEDLEVVFNTLNIGSKVYIY